MTALRKSWNLKEGFNYKEIDSEFVLIRFLNEVEACGVEDNWP